MSKIPQKHLDAYVEFFTILARIDKRVKMEKKQKEKEQEKAVAE